MKIGDKTPWPKDVPYDPFLIRIAMKQRGLTAKTAKRSGNNERVNQAKKIIRGEVELAARRVDPFEQARLFLGRRGIPVFTAAIYDPKFDIDRIGPDGIARLIDENPWVAGDEWFRGREDVVELARARGWQG